MIRVPAPLVEPVRELARLHRAGRTKAVVDGLRRLTEAIDSESDIDIASITETISKLTERLDRLETESRQDIDIASVAGTISERLEKIENDIESIALSISGLNNRVSGLEDVDINVDVESIAELDINADVEMISATLEPLSQKALAERLGATSSTIKNFRKKGKESFAVWSSALDPDGLAWTWTGESCSGRVLPFVPIPSQP